MSRLVALLSTVSCILDGVDALPSNPLLRSEPAFYPAKNMLLTSKDSLWNSFASSPEELAPWFQFVKSIPEATPVGPLEQHTDENGKKVLDVNMKWRISDDIEKGIGFPKGKYKLLVDVGLEVGTYAPCYLEQHPDTVLLALEAHPVNFGVSYEHTVRQLKTVDSYKRQDVLRRMKVLPLGVSSESGLVTFRESASSACGSILPSYTNGAWFCAEDLRHITVPVVRLDQILDMVPAEYEFLSLKTDVEGADLLALQGAGRYVERFKYISFECHKSDVWNGKPYRPGNCNREEAHKYLATQGHVEGRCDDISNCFYSKGETQTHAAQCFARLSELENKDVNCATRSVAECDK